MKRLNIDKSEPQEVPHKQRVQNVVTAFLNHPDDKEKQLAAIQKALELNAKERQSEAEEARRIEQLGSDSSVQEREIV